MIFICVSKVDVIFLLNKFKKNIIMQHEKAKSIRKSWGNKACNHPKVEKEYYLGTQTGDKVCTTCGREVGDPDFETSKKNTEN